MSNLIKSVYFNVDASHVCTIDSDERVEEFIPHIYDKREEIVPFDFEQLDGEADGEESDLDSYKDGLSVISMDDVVSGEREKLAREMEEELGQKQQEILEQAKEEADALLAKAKEEADTVYAQARAEGEKKGREEGQMQVQIELQQMKEQLQAEYDQRAAALDEQEKNLEPAFAEIVASLVKKLTGVVCENKKDVICYLIGNAMKNLEKTKNISVRVAKADMARVSAKKSTFQLIAKNTGEFEIVEDASLTQNQCIIETDNKIIECSLDAQLQNLEEHIKLLV